MSMPSSLLRTLGFTGAYVVATYAGRLTVMDETSLSMVWPAAGVSAVWFLAQRTSRWHWLDMLALAVVTMVVNVATGAPAALAGFFVVANLAQALMFAWLFSRWLPHLWPGGGAQPLTRLQDLWRLVTAAFVSTACGTLIGPTGVWVVTDVYSWPATAVWLTRNTVSILLIGAATIRLGHVLLEHFHRVPGTRRARLRGWWTAMAPLRRAEYAALLVVSAVAYILVFGITHGLPLAFPLLVMTVWAGLRLHTGFVVLHDVAFGCLSVAFTLRGLGPFGEIGSHPIRALIAQLFVGMLAVVGLALALSRDERTALLGRLRRSDEHSQGQAKLMKAILDAMTEGLTVVDERGRLLLRNPAVRHLLGGVAGDSLAMAEPARYGLMNPDGTPLTSEQMPYRRAFAGQNVHGMDILVRNPGVPGGRLLNATSTAMPDEVDGVRYAVTVFHDVTAERRHRDELASFAGVVAHDLLNPLATVQGWTEALAEAFADDPCHPAAAEAADGVVRIRRAAARMDTMINDLLAYTTAGDATLTPVAVDLTDVVGDIATARIDHALSNGTPVPVFDIGDLHAVQADPVLVRQLLDNLISNAIRYTASGVSPRIAVSTETDGEMVTVTIGDNGVGIPFGQHSSIFDNFHRAHRTAGYSGTGLGLGICKRIVERHGGTIAAGNNPTGPGSTFTLTLPAAGSTPPTAGTTPPAPAQQLARPRTVAPTAAASNGEDHAAGMSPQAAVSQPAAAPAPLPPAAGFEYTARLILDYLHEQFPLAYWAVTRVENGRQVHLYLDADDRYGLRQGDSHPWEDGSCVHTAAGRAPAVDAQAIPRHTPAGVNDAITVGTCAGAVINQPDGTLFGAVCGRDPHARTHDTRLPAGEPLLALLGQLLTAALMNDRARRVRRAGSPRAGETGASSGRALPVRTG